MSKQELSIPALANRVQTEADAYLLLEELRWGGQPTACPQCGESGRCYFLKPKDGTQGRKTRTGANSQRRVWKCGACRKQFSVLTGTIFHGTKIPIRTWLFVIFEFCASKNGVAAREIERKYDITAKSAWFMLHRIREATKREPLAGLLSGTVVADETWIGGKPGNQHRAKRNAMGADRWGTNKTTVLSLVHPESGETRSQVIANVQGTTLRAAIEREVDLGATTLWTDSWSGYVAMAGTLKGHETVNHNVGEYVRNGITSNSAERFFSQLKRSIDGTHHRISVEHLPRYLSGFDFMATHHAATDSARMRVLIGQVDGRRLTYRPLTAR